MTKAVNDNIPIPAVVHGDQRHAPFPLDLRAINNAAADVCEIQHSLARIAGYDLADFAPLDPDELIRCRVMLADVERIVAREMLS